MFHLAVVVVSWNVRELLAACLRSLFADVERLGLEAQVWVVDNASADGTLDMVAEAFTAVHLVASQENLGFAGGNNVALREILHLSSSIPNYIWLLNPDTEVQPGATRALVAALDANPQVGVVGPKLVYADGSLQHSAFRFPGLVQLVFELFSLPPRFYDTSLNGRYPRRLYEGGVPFLVGHPLGASMTVRTEVISQVGLMDEGYRLYCEEVDWCWRMHKAGWRALCVPSARVVHYAGQSTVQVPISSFVHLWTSRARLYARHHGPVTWRLARALVRIGMRRWMRGASPDKVAACRQIIQVWGEAR
jgi:N-acetylglucosaminyl-diphospho-decaprenol L-rhamnosyltransferase